MIKHQYKGGEIYIEEHAGTDLFREHINSVPPHPITLARRMQGTEEDYFKREPIEATTAFERNRRRVEESLQKLVAFLWDHFNLPRDGIIEYGSGATGYYHAILKPQDVTNWLQVEINPKAIAENLRKNPKASVVEGSYN